MRRAQVRFGVDNAEIFNNGELKEMRLATGPNQRDEATITNIGGGIVTLNARILRLFRLREFRHLTRAQDGSPSGSIISVSDGGEAKITVRDPCLVRTPTPEQRNSNAGHEHRHPYRLRRLPLDCGLWRHGILL